jgi:hypothetical protein
MIFPNLSQRSHLRGPRETGTVQKVNWPNRGPNNYVRLPSINNFIVKVLTYEKVLRYLDIRDYISIDGGGTMEQ